MSTRQQNKTLFFKCRNPLNMRSGQRLVEADFSVDFKKVFGSWFKFKDSFSLKSNSENEKLRQVFNKLFQVHQEKLMCDWNAEKRYHKSKKSNLVYIDLNKIDDNVHLDKFDKEKLQTILNSLIYNDGKEDVHTQAADRCKNAKTIKRKKTRNKYKSKRKIMLKAQSNNKNRVQPNEKRYDVESNEKDMYCCECYSRTPTKKDCFNTRRNPTISPTVSQEKILQNCLDLDPLTCGDAARLRRLRKDQRSKSLNSLFRISRNVNIKNIDLKYLKPTYILQCYHNGELYQNSSNNFERDRYYSSAALEAHLGHTASPDLIKTGKSAREKSDVMHYDMSHTHVIGTSKKNIRKSMDGSNFNKKLEKKLSMEEDNGEEDRIIGWRSFNSSPTDEEVSPVSPRKKWDKDSFPSFLWSADEIDKSTSAHKTLKEVENNMESKCKPIADFMKACLCLSIGDKSEPNLVIVRSPVKGPKQRYIEMNSKKMSPVIRRTTENEFFKCNVKNC